jgi:hypothetical protein
MSLVNISPDEMELIIRVLKHRVSRLSDLYENTEEMSIHTLIWKLERV